jgi:hypothetical protein
MQRKRREAKRGNKESGKEKRLCGLTFGLVTCTAFNDTFHLHYTIAMYCFIR